MSDVDSFELCRDESCPIIRAHRKHLIASHPPVRPHRRPSRKPAWEQDDPDGLRGSVVRAVSLVKPTVISEIIRDVRDDYGHVSERTIYRYVRQLVKIGRLVKLDLGFTFAAYIQPGARVLGDPEAMREIILGETDFGPGCTSTIRYA